MDQGQGASSMYITMVRSKSFDNDLKFLNHLMVVITPHLSHWVRLRKSFSLFGSLNELLLRILFTLPSWNAKSVNVRNFSPENWFPVAADWKFVNSSKLTRLAGKTTVADAVVEVDDGFKLFCSQFTNILRAAFAPISLRRKSLNLQCKYRKAALKSLVRKSCS